MRQKRNKKQRLKLFLRMLTLVAASMILECQLCFPKEITIFEGERPAVRSASAYSVELPASAGGTLTEAGRLEPDSYASGLALNDDGGYRMTVKLFGLIPVRSVTVHVEPQTELAACGNTVGIKIFTKGLLCVGTQELKETNGRRRSLSREADIRAGDILIALDDIELTDTEQMSRLIRENDGKSICLTLLRSGRLLKKELVPLRTAEGFKLGLWLRDSTAGIGTLTYYNPENSEFGALGHPITDTDTDALMPVSDGSLLRAGIIGIKKGEKGEPGELKGIFKTSEPSIGEITKNTQHGIFGRLAEEPESARLYPVASGSRVHEGAATILSNIQNEQVEEFSIEIQKTTPFHLGESKDMILRVTDERLLETTGGIVQGMSGSPIIQDGRIVGAVTHVCVNL